MKRRWIVGALTACCLTAVAATGSGAAPGMSGAEPADLEVNATGTSVTWQGDLAGPAPCPEGMTRAERLGGTHFERGLPNPSFLDGWERTGNGLGGGSAARARVGSSDARDHMFLDWVKAPVGARTMLAIASRTNSPSSSYTRAQVNSVDLRVRADDTRWRGRVYDVTAATDDEQGRLGGWLELRSYQGRSGYWEVDNAQYFTCRSAPVSRIAGPDRYATSARLSARLPVGTDTAYLALGTGYADAIGAGALAGLEQAPVLLVREDDIPTVVRRELTRLRPDRIVVVGGSTAVQDVVLRQAEQYATTGEVDRLAGTTRYGTSARIAQEYTSGRSAVYVAAGTNYADALSGSARAARSAQPIVFVEPTRIPDVIGEELQRLDPREIIIIGGTSSVSPTVLRQLRSFARDGEVRRWAGDDRYRTSAIVADTFPSGLSRAYVATGSSYPDALSGGALAGGERVPLLLTRSDALPARIGRSLTDLRAGAGVVIGGQSSVHSLVLDQVGARVG